MESAQWFELAETRGDNREAFEEIHLLLETSMKTLRNPISQGSPGLYSGNLWRYISIAKESMRANAEHDHDKILETLQMFYESLPTAIAKLQGTPDMYNLPIISQRIIQKKMPQGAW
ncbi:unnamed protein product [Sphagnum balticum]